MFYTSNSLMAFTHSVLLGFGCNENEASIVADHLVLANLTGHDSHGIGMLPMYGAQVRDGNLIPNQKPVFHEPVGAISVVDAQRGFGHRITLLALDHAMKTIAEHRVAVLGLRNSGHVSRVGTYSEYCASKGYVSIHFVNVVGHQPLVAPFGAREPGFSTNPISMAMPVQEKAKPLLDMATSTVAFGKIRVASNKGETVPLGYLLDDEGVPTNNPDPMATSRSGAMSAFGEHKGSGLGLFAELLAGALAGKATIAAEDYIPEGVFNNMFSVIIDPAAFDSSDEVAKRTTQFYDYIKAKPTAKGVDELLMPGEPEQICKTKRLAQGIPVDDETMRQILEIAETFGLSEAELTRQLVEAELSE